MNRQSITKAQKPNDSTLLPASDILQRKMINRTDFGASSVDTRSSSEQVDKTSLQYVETHFNHDFSKIPIRLNSLYPIQTKLKIGQPNDKYEHEADRVAEQVMRMPDPRSSSSVVNPSLGNNTNSNSGTIQRACASCSEDEELIQAKTAGVITPEMTPAISSGIQSLQGGGQPLSGSERGFFEPRFGADFSKVRVHKDTRAASAARSVNARAFTLGHNVVFGAGEYSSDSMAGRKLLAHELVHTVQQRGVRPRVQRDIDPSQNLAAERFKGDPELENVFDGETIYRAYQRPRGPSVRKVQEALLDLRFKLPKFGPDGIYGPETASAVIEFQRDSEFAVEQLDGRLGPLTMAELDRRFAEVAEGGTKDTSETIGEEIEDGDVPPGPTVSVGEKSISEKELEQKQSPDAEFELSKSAPVLSSSLFGLQAAPIKGGRVDPPKPNNLPTITNIDVDLRSPNLTYTFNTKFAPPKKKGAKAKKLPHSGKKVVYKDISSGRGCPNLSSDPCSGNSGMYCTPDGSFKIDKLGADGAKYVSSLGDSMPFFTVFCNNRGIGLHKGKVLEGHAALSHGCVRIAALSIAKEIHKNVTSATTVKVHGQARTRPWSLKPSSCKKSWRDCGALCEKDKKKRPNKTPKSGTC